MKMFKELCVPAFVLTLAVLIGFQVIDTYRVSVIQASINKVERTFNKEGTQEFLLVTTSEGEKITASTDQYEWLKTNLGKPLTLKLKGTKGNIFSNRELMPKN
jgi:hypothetical protein